MVYVYIIRKELTLLLLGYSPPPSLSPIHLQHEFNYDKEEEKEREKLLHCEIGWRKEWMQRKKKKERVR